MYKSKLFALFNRLSGKDKRAINKIVCSPFFNQREDIKRFWEYLVESKGGDSLSLRKNKIHAIVYPDQSYDESKMRYLMSWMLKIIEEYLCYTKFKASELTQKLYLAEVYRGLNLEKHFDHTIYQAENLLNASVVDRRFYESMYALEFEKYAFAEDQKRTKANNLQELSNRLDLWILTAKFKQACMLLAHQTVFTAEYDYSFLQSLLKHTEQHPELLENPGIAVYYFCYRALTEDSEDYFIRFRNELNLRNQKFAEGEMRNLYQLGINFCIRRLNKGSDYYIKEALDLYRVSIEKGFLLNDGIISRFAYKNVVALALKLKEYEWTEKFIHEYQSSLEMKYRKSNFSYNLAKLYISKKDFKKAMTLLQEVNDSDLLLNLSSKVMLLKMYYELGEFEALDSLLNSFQVYLHRKKAMGYHKSHYQDTINFTRRMLYLQANDNIAIEKLRLDIQQAVILPERNWFLEQLSTVK